jgi:hypothetical protein
MKRLLSDGEGFSIHKELEASGWRIPYLTPFMTMPHIIFNVMPMPHVP